MWKCDICGQIFSEEDEIFELRIGHVKKSDLDLGAVSFIPIGAIRGCKACIRKTLEETKEKTCIICGYDIAAGDKLPMKKRDEKWRGAVEIKDGVWLCGECLEGIKRARA